MQTRSFNLLLAAATFLLLSGCQKGLTDNQNDLLSKSGKGAGSLTPLGTTTPDVYVAGTLNGQSAYWKNGVAVLLPGGGQATGIVAIGSNVYVCGWGNDPTTHQYEALYWKNGVLTILSDPNSSALAYGIYVSGTDVYVAGYLGTFVRTGVYWKNGVATTLGSGQPEGIFVAPNGDIYIPNGETASFGSNKGPTYWKNGTLVTLPGDGASYVSAIAVQGTNVYAVGTSDKGATQTALYWKNSVAQPMFQRQNTMAWGVAVSSTGQALITGTSGSSVSTMQIVYWNGLGDLNVLSSGDWISINTGITVNPGTGDVYVCGSESNSPNSGAKYWKIPGGTGTPQPIFLGANATANAITLGL